MTDGSRGRPAHIRPAHVLDVDAEALLREWDMWMVAGNLRPATRTERLRIVRQFSRDTGQHPGVFTRDALLYASIAGDRSESTRLSYYRALRAWHRWLLDTERREDDPTEGLPRPREPKRQPRPTATQDLERLLCSGIRWRTRAMVLLAALAGCRASEIAAVRGEDVDLTARLLRIRGKGGKDRTVPMNGLLVELGASMPARGWWFPAADGAGPIHSKTVSSTVSRAMARARVSGTCHSLRHWFGTSSLDTGGTIREVQELLGHGSVATTQLYTAVNASGLHAVVDRLPDLSVAARTMRQLKRGLR
jgi:integrase/recombinase XerD